MKKIFLKNFKKVEEGVVGYTSSTFKYDLEEFQGQEYVCKKTYSYSHGFGKYDGKYGYAVTRLEVYCAKHWRDFCGPFFVYRAEDIIKILGIDEVFEAFDFEKASKEVWQEFKEEAPALIEAGKPVLYIPDRDALTGIPEDELSLIDKALAHNAALCKK